MAAADQPREPKSVTGVPLTIITGLSGAGKSTAMRLLEDLGCYCVDNLPPALIPSFFTLFEHSDSAGLDVVIASDVRSGALFDDFADTVTALGETGVEFQILYLDSATHVLINRYKEVRRDHPLHQGRSLEEAIEVERRRLEPIRAIAHHIIDTSTLDPAGLREALLTRMAGGDVSGAARVRVVSFGFKYGAPRDADFVFDVRFLPNPFYEPTLQPLTGEDDAVYEFVMSDPRADDYFGKVVELLTVPLESFVALGKLTLTVGIGCTGGRHRSVAFARRLAAHFERAGRQSQLVHRDAAKPQA
jgi:UPF0042 nucleotide-binding protein